MFLKENKDTVQILVDRAELLAKKCQDQMGEFVLCHSDIHGGNVLIDEQNSIFIVDWDDPIMAPKERDLMFIGGGVANVWNKPREEKFFYEGYESINVNQMLIAHYRHERILEDIVLYCKALLFYLGKPTGSTKDVYPVCRDVPIKGCSGHCFENIHLTGADRD